MQPGAGSSLPIMAPAQSAWCRSRRMEPSGRAATCDPSRRTGPRLQTALATAGFERYAPIGFNTENAPVMMNWMRRQWPMACAITEHWAAICGCAGLMHNAAVLFAPVSCRAIGPNLNKEKKERDFSAFQVYH